MVLDVLDKEKFLKENEVLNDLLGYDGLKIIQNPEMFNFSLDSTLLGDYATLNKNAKSIAEVTEHARTQAQTINNVMTVSGGQQKDSVIHIHATILP